LGGSEQEADDITTEYTITIKENDSFGIKQLILETVLRHLSH